MITCLIIEDEPLATDILVEYVQQLPYLQLKGTCTDALQALEIIHGENIDLLLLDIHLPVLKGLDFLKTLQNPPAIILTTAYHEYAVQGYALNVVDYLVKPIQFNRFVEAVNKVRQKNIFSKKQTLTFHSDKKTILLSLEDIVFIESQKEYIKIHTTSGSHLTKYALSKLESELDASLFLRIHRSFIVSYRHIKAFNAQEIEVSGTILPIGGNYKEMVIEMLHKTFP